MFKLLVIGVIIVGKDPFALFGMQAPGVWEWGQGNKVHFNLGLHQSTRCWSRCPFLKPITVYLNHLIFSTLHLCMNLLQSCLNVIFLLFYVCAESQNLIPLRYFRFMPV